MTKEWTCTQCKDSVSKSLVATLREGPPEQCETCGNTEFEEAVFGSIHRSLDAIA